MNIAILLAGGSGSRFGADRPKQFLEVDGCTVLEHSIRAFHRSPLVDDIVIITRQDFVDEVNLRDHRLRGRRSRGGERRKDESF